ncbi:hypothetical protein Fot_18582 [Forsythia ovata]|uniref:Uncharacterized protein n=1 Tax=Forsythia ovata TaxID=205694 RepID=A0ABD1VIL8_9LAMI
MCVICASSIGHSIVVLAIALNVAVTISRFHLAVSSMDDCFEAYKLAFNLLHGKSLNSNSHGIMVSINMNALFYMVKKELEKKISTIVDEIWTTGLHVFWYVNFKLRNTHNKQQQESGRLSSSIKSKNQVANETKKKIVGRQKWSKKMIVSCRQHKPTKLSYVEAGTTKKKQEVYSTSSTFPQEKTKKNKGKPTDV